MVCLPLLDVVAPAGMQGRLTQITILGKKTLKGILKITIR
jgi:hypothetical protein